MHTKKWLWLRSKHAQIFKTHEEKCIVLLKHGKKYYMPVLRGQGRVKYPTEEMPNVSVLLSLEGCREEAR